MSGIKGQHWHKKRYQNSDGTYTEAGKPRHAAAERARYNSKTLTTKITASSSKRSPSKGSYEDMRKAKRAAYVQVGGKQGLKDKRGISNEDASNRLLRARAYNRLGKKKGTRKNWRSDTQIIGDVFGLSYDGMSPSTIQAGAAAVGGMF